MARKRRRPSTAACGCSSCSPTATTRVSVTALAEALGVARPVVYRLLATLEEHGLRRAPMVPVAIEPVWAWPI